MLKRFSVTGFKNFRDMITLALDEPANYEFCTDILRNNVITKAMIYGINGSGKSNLGLAIFDIVLHLTDKERVYYKYKPYLNLNSETGFAEFTYVFVFDGTELVYQYGKSDYDTLVYEKMFIGDKLVIEYDFVRKEGKTLLKGTETLSLQSDPFMEGNNKLSRVKYVSNNAILDDDNVNRVFVAFMRFVDNMLMFYSLDGNGYQGFSVGSESFTQYIAINNKALEFKKFLKENGGINYNLRKGKLSGEYDLFCVYDRKIVPFMQVASTGTRSLALFYYWYLRMSEASFVYIDEYDAFYHFELAQKLIELVKKLPDTQVILSTHNTDLISNDILRPDAYFEISDNTISPFYQNTDKELRMAHNLQKMYKAGAFSCQNR